MNHVIRKQKHITLLIVEGWRLTVASWAKLLTCSMFVPPKLVGRKTRAETDEGNLNPSTLASIHILTSAYIRKKRKRGILRISTFL